MKLTIATCGDACGGISKPTIAQIAEYCNYYNFTATEPFECGFCSNRDAWTIPEMLWSKENDFMVTTCCHTEAIASLIPENPAQVDKESDRDSYVWAVTGR